MDSESDKAGSESDDGGNDNDDDAEAEYLMEFAETKKLQVIINNCLEEICIVCSHYFYMYINIIQLISQKRNESEKMKIQKKQMK